MGRFALWGAHHSSRAAMMGSIYGLWLPAFLSIYRPRPPQLKAASQRNVLCECIPLIRELVHPLTITLESQENTEL